MRFGAAVSAVVLAATIATMPAAVRIAPPLAPACGGFSVWVALVALAIPPLAVATVLFRHAVAALRLFDGRSVVTGVMTALVWGASTFVVLTALGGVLRATTHHHGLAGVTFATGGFVAAGMLALVAHRFVSWAHAAPWILRWLVVGAVGSSFGVTVAFLGRALGRSDAAGAVAVDVLAFTFAAAFGAGAFPHRSQPFVPFAVAGPPVAAILLVVGFATLGASPSLRVALDEEAPLVSPVLDLMRESSAH